MISFLKVFLAIVWLFMIYIMISTSLASSLFEEWNFLLSLPWMRATLCDFYGNVLVIYGLVLYRERSVPVKVLWALLFFFSGQHRNHRLRVGPVVQASAIRRDRGHP